MAALPKVTLGEIVVKTISLADFATVWRVSSKEVLKVGDDEYIRLGAHNHSLISLIFEENEDLEGVERDKNFSLARFNGLNMLVNFRNDAQAKELRDAHRPHLFSFVEDEKMADKARKKAKAAEKKGMVEPLKPIVLQIPWPVGEDSPLTVLKPVNARDAVYIKFSDHDLAVALQLLRNNGLCDHLLNPRQNPDGVKGIWKRSSGGKEDGYTVRVYMPDGSKKYKHAASLDDAINIHQAGPDGLTAEDEEGAEVAEPVDDTAASSSARPVGVRVAYG